MSFNFPSNYYQIDSFNNNKITKNEHDLREIIYELKDRIIELEQENKNNLLIISELTKTKKEFIELEKSNQSLAEELISKEKIISELKSLLLKEQQDNNDEKRILEKNFDTKLMYYKRLQDTNNYKEKAASSIIKLNEIQHYSIIKLENKIDEIKNFYENKLKQNELEFDKKHTKLKKKMMDFLKNAQKNMVTNSKKDLELNTKLGILYKNEMLNELENQSHTIEELLKEKEKQNKEIFLLKQELMIHKKVEEMIKNKNSKFLNVINKIKINISQKKDEFNNCQKEKDNSDINLKSNKNKKLIIKDFKKRAKSVKNIKMNFYEGNAGILNDYITGNTSNSNSTKNIKILEKCRTPSNIKKNINKIITQSEKQEFIKLEENDENDIYQNNIMGEKSEILIIINEIVDLCNQALEIVLRENKFSQSFKDTAFQNDINIKSDFLELNDDLKYELLIGLITKVLNFLKINNNNKGEKENIFKLKRRKSELLKMNDEYNVKFTKLLDNENYNKMKKLKLKNQKLKYDKLLNIVGINKPNFSSSQKDFFSFKIKKNKLFNQKGGNYLVNSFTKGTPNLLKRYIHISNNLNKNNIKNNTFLFSSKK